MSDNDKIAELTPEQLNEAIALKLGWHIVTLDTPEIIRPKPENGTEIEIKLHCHVADGEGNKIGWNWQTPELAWEHAGIPDYCGDVREALQLVKGLRFMLETLPGNRWSATLGSGTQVHSSTSHSAARAIALAWYGAADFLHLPEFLV